MEPDQKDRSAQADIPGVRPFAEAGLPDRSLNLRLRLATLDDAPLVLETMQQAFAEYRGALRVPSSAHAETLADVQAALSDHGSGAVLAFVGDTAVGSARFRPQDTDADLYVGRVSVLPAYRRRGVASALMRFLMDLTAERGRQAIVINVRHSLPSNVGLYQALGFEVVSIDPHPRGDDRVWTMRKRV